MRQVDEGSLDPLPLVSDRIPLEEAATGYERFGRREASKVLMHP
jgi:threonine dehydrogenase-like Zn-dependent dehydrogenase